MPVALIPQFAQMADKQALRTGFLHRNHPTLPPPFDELSGTRPGMKTKVRLNHLNASEH
jgi:hypothetical protein